MSFDDPLSSDGIATDYPESTLSPAVRAVVSSACPSPSDALPATMCRTVATADSSSSPPLEALTSSLIALEGYARIRGTMMLEDRSDADERPFSTGRPLDPTTALLASDFLFARAHSAVTASPLEDRRVVACIRTVTSASSDLVAAFSRTADAAGAADPALAGRSGDPRSPMAVLCGCACELGAIVGDRPDALHDPIRAYGHALGAIVDAEAAVALADHRYLRVAGDADSLHRWLCRVLEDDAGSPPMSMSSGDSGDQSALAAPLKTARDAYGQLETWDEIDAYTLEVLGRPVRLLEQELEGQGQPTDGHGAEGSRSESSDGSDGSESSDGTDDAHSDTDRSSASVNDVDGNEGHDRDEPGDTHYSSEDDR
ncbi:hypothetical protein ACLI4Q_19470 [Natrialbaceae archaeon A-CW1-1]